MKKRSAMFFVSDVYSAVSDLMIASEDHEDPAEFIEASIHKLEKELQAIREKKQTQEGL